MATDELQDDVADLLDGYEPDEPGGLVDDTGMPIEGVASTEIDPSKPLQADVIDVALSQGPDGHNAPAKKSMAKSVSALQLRIQGHSYDTIAKEVGYANPQAASLAVNRALAKQATENVKDFIKLQQRRYNYLLAGVFRTALDREDEKQIQALNAVLAVMESMNKLEGVDKLNAGITDSQVVMIDSETDSYRSQLQEMAKQNEIEAAKDEDDDERELRDKLMGTMEDGWADLDEEFGVMEMVEEVVEAEIVEEGDESDE